MDVCLLWVPFFLSSRGLCDELITGPEESYRLWCNVVCDLETSWMRRPWPTGGALSQKQQRNVYLKRNVYASSCWLEIISSCRQVIDKFLMPVYRLAVITWIHDLIGEICAQKKCTHIQTLARPYTSSLFYSYLTVIRVRGGADKSLTRPTSPRRRTESIVSLEITAELRVFSCYRGWKEAC